MCLSLALGVMTTAMQLASASAAADRQNAAYQQNALNANADAVEKYAQNQMQQIQEEAKAARERLMNKEAALNAKGTALAGAINEGSSINSVLNDISRQAGRNDDVTNVNLRNAQIQAATNTSTISSEAKSRIGSVATAEQPSLIQAAVIGLGNIAPTIKTSSNTTGKDHGGSTT